MTKSHRFLIWVGYVTASFAAVGLIGYRLYVYARLVLTIDGRNERLPGWDAACHGFDGLQFARKFAQFDVPGFIEHLGRMTYWPPLYPLIESIGFSMLGPQYIIARNMMLGMGVAGVAATFVAGWLLSKELGLVIGLIAALLLSSSHWFQFFSVVEILEVPGVFFGMIALALYTLYLNTNSRWMLRAACVGAGLLFFCKYNFGLLWIIPMVVWEFFREPKPFLKIGDVFVKTLTSVKWLNVSGILILLYGALLAWVVMSGGWNFEILGQEIRFESILGNPIYILIVAVLLKLIFSGQGTIRKFISDLLHIPDPVASILRYLCMPIMVWFLWPPNFNTFFYAVTNNNGEPPNLTPEALAYYPRLLAEDFFGYPALGWGVIGSFLLSWLMIPFQNQRQRFLALASLFAFALCVLHPHHDPRFIVSILPFIYLTAVSTVVTLLRNILILITPRMTNPMIYSLGFALAGFIFIELKPRHDQLTKDFHDQTYAEQYLRSADFICQSVELGTMTAVVGHSFFFAPDLLKWHCAIKTPHAPDHKLPLELRDLKMRFGKNSYEEILADTRVNQWIVIKPSPFDPKNPEPWRDPDDLIPFSEFLAHRQDFHLDATLDEQTHGFTVLRYRRLETL